MLREVPSLRWRETAKALSRLGFLSREGKGHLLFYPASNPENAFALPRHSGELKRVIVLKMLKWLETAGVAREQFLKALK
jgi:predicted RNA binding protein YcfA (HicA-like mRNA interferase family)